MGAGTAHTGEIKLLPAKELQCDPRVQREVRATWVKRLTSEWSGFDGPVHVSIRDDGFMSVVDGWHRVLAFREQPGFNGDKIFCQVYKHLTVQEEAALFRKLNTRAQVSQLDDFRVAITAGDVEAVAINGIIESLGLSVGIGGDGQIAAVMALKNVYRGARIVARRENGEPLRAALRMLLNAWGKQRAALEGNLISGAGYVVLRHGKALDRDDLSQKLAPYPGGPAALLGIAKGVKAVKGAALPHCVAAVLVDVANKGKRSNKLPDWWSS